tara:strand:+ start:12931 stop:13239 length:309 start_codon:yes stop_codon:yes gene_type:complete
MTTDQIYEMVLERKSWAYLATKIRISGICTSDPRIEGYVARTGPAGGLAPKKTWRLRPNHELITKEIEDKEQRLGSRWKQKIERRKKLKGTPSSRENRYGSG